MRTEWTGVGGPDGIRSRVCRPPSAFSIRSSSCILLTQQYSPRDSDSARILVRRWLPATNAKPIEPHAPRRICKAQLPNMRLGIALALPNPFEKYRNCRPVRWPFPYVMQGHPSHWVYDNVAAQLVDVIRGAPRPTSARDQPGVRPPGRGPPDRRPLAVTHPITAIEHAPPVNQQRPPEIRFAHVFFGMLQSLERHDDDAHIQPRELVLLPSQLRQVLPAGQSAEVSVEDHQKPVSAVLAEPMDDARGVLQRKCDGRRSGLGRHLTLLCRHDPPRRGLTVASLVAPRASPRPDFWHEAATIREIRPHIPCRIPIGCWSSAMPTTVNTTARTTNGTTARLAARRSA
jgi:hypothetical protein